jgi:hypothetical protein
VSWACWLKRMWSSEGRAVEQARAAAAVCRNARACDSLHEQIPSAECVRAIAFLLFNPSLPAAAAAAAAAALAAIGAVVVAGLLPDDNRTAFLQ